MNRQALEGISFDQEPRSKSKMILKLEHINDIWHKITLHCSLQNKEWTLSKWMKLVKWTVWYYMYNCYSLNIRISNKNNLVWFWLAEIFIVIFYKQNFTVAMILTCLVVLKGKFSKSSNDHNFLFLSILNKHNFVLLP